MVDWIYVSSRQARYSRDGDGGRCPRQNGCLPCAAPRIPACGSPSSVALMVQNLGDLGPHRTQENPFFMNTSHKTASTGSRLTEEQKARGYRLVTRFARAKPGVRCYICRSVLEAGKYAIRVRKYGKNWELVGRWAWRCPSPCAPAYTRSDSGFTNVSSWDSAKSRQETRRNPKG